ncbi:hypothetical protein MGMO_18c00020 [Methyloglobulus morosus KoM1]|uniref:Uncharacterized protein n=1 Tax=Methyloglobulus morosus KoM1 TaxID=1116472 RepID=V5C090_9GAMM|nr:hypothetical protein [Methyloglobulus morosus]ESS73494.1 hypothetical protein MGMO_18c00020 [Methyloglobulus morosus KoM1]
MSTISDNSEISTLSRIVRSQVEHEDNLISHRISWLLMSHSFIFSAYATLLVWPPGYPKYEVQIAKLADLIPLLGCASALLVWITVLAAIINTSLLYCFYCEKETPSEQSLEVPPILGNKWTHLFGLSAPALLPPILFYVWWQFI